MDVLSINEVKWFRRRVPSRTVALRPTGRVTPLPPHPGPEPRELIDVIGIGATQVIGPTAVTLLSVERYREGYVLQFRLTRDAPNRSRQFLRPEMNLTVSDGGRTAYSILPMGGGGGGGGGRFLFREAYRAGPPAPVGTEDLVIEASEVRWQEHDSRRGEMKTVAADAGPWRFVVPLPKITPDRLKST